MKKLMILAAAVAMTSTTFAAKKTEGPRDKAPQKERSNNIKDRINARENIQSKVDSKTSQVIGENVAFIEKQFGSIGNKIAMLATEGGLKAIYGEKGIESVKEDLAGFKKAMIKVEQEESKDLANAKNEALTESIEAAKVLSEAIQTKIYNASSKLTSSEKEEINDLVLLFKVMTYHAESVIGDSKEVNVVKNYTEMAKQITSEFGTGNVSIPQAVKNVFANYVKATNSKLTPEQLKEKMKKDCKMGALA